MFEKPILPTAYDEAPDGTQLHAPSWAELVAKLAAVRDLRRALKQDTHAKSGAFTEFHAAREEQLNEAAETVNLDASAVGKAISDIKDVTENNATHGDREI